MSCIFEKLATPSLNKRGKICFKPFFVFSSAKDGLKRGKNLVFSLFCILVGMPIGGGAVAPY